jgi:hypothetical protein
MRVDDTCGRHLQKLARGGVPMEIVSRESAPPPRRKEFSFKWLGEHRGVNDSRLMRRHVQLPCTEATRKWSAC